MSMDFYGQIGFLIIAIMVSTFNFTRPSMLQPFLISICYRLIGWPRRIALYKECPERQEEERIFPLVVFWHILWHPTWSVCHVVHARHIRMGLRFRHSLYFHGSINCSLQIDNWFYTHNNDGEVILIKPLGVQIVKAIRAATSKQELNLDKLDIVIISYNLTYPKVLAIKQHTKRHQPKFCMTYNSQIV